ncbi:MmcQ/YjbR family DNA-binding protein [Gracilibacillus timonensis]|uniref:MmcQ/YjbR family DNA-binding protein n=1 Tax=Gracilibacillus timonensis TaxID=1816696 RepID=UPI000824EE10|nr:MmcQ/YjbR family DNA-binding protein [Gracilibacillus timonensis]
MVNRSDVFDFVQETYDIKPDYPWKTYANYAVLRHEKNGKWFGLIMDITKDKIGLDSEEKTDVLNVKVRKEFVGSLRKEEGIYPAYHMNKLNWVSIHLAEMKSIHPIKDLIAESFELTI